MPRRCCGRATSSARASAGHVDLPRLTDGNVALQVFSAASQLSWRGDPHRTIGEADGGPGLRPDDAAGGRPAVAAANLGQRSAARRCTRREQLKALVRRAGSRLIAIRSQADIDRLLLARSQAQANGLHAPVGVMLVGEWAGRPGRPAREPRHAVRCGLPDGGAAVVSEARSSAVRRQAEPRPGRPAGRPAPPTGSRRSGGSG